MDDFSTLYNRLCAMEPKFRPRAGDFALYYGLMHYNPESGMVWKWAKSSSEVHDVRLIPEPLARLIVLGQAILFGLSNEDAMSGMAAIPEPKAGEPVLEPLLEAIIVHIGQMQPTMNWRA